MNQTAFIIRTLHALLILPTLLGRPISTRGQIVVDPTWTGDVDDNWSNAGNWDPGSFYPNNGNGVGWILSGLTRRHGRSGK